MSAVVNHDEAEQTRVERAAELSGEQGANWADAYRPGSFGCHELLDRASHLADSIEHLLLSHPGCVARAEWYALAEQAASALRELYQRVGSEHLNGDNGDVSRV